MTDIGLQSESTSKLVNSESIETSESTNDDSLMTQLSKNGENTVSRKEDVVQYAVFCSPSHQTCGQGDTNDFELKKVSLKFLKNHLTSKGEVCVDKCCRGSKVLKASPNEKLECVVSNHSEWSPKNLEMQLGLDSLSVRSWLFYLKRNLEVLS